MSANDSDLLVQYLGSLSALPSNYTAPGSADRGRVLFHRIGCVQCHLAEPLQANLSDRHTRESLAAFLQNPLVSRPAGRMPRTPVTAQEASDLAAFLLKGASPSRAALRVNPARAAQGKLVFDKLGCSACHGTAPARAKPLTSLDATKGCLGESVSGVLPDYRFTPAQRQSVRAILSTKPDPAEMLTTLGCSACHHRGSKGPDPARDQFFEVREDTDLGDEGRLPPRLDGIGAKLTRSGLEDALRGKVRVRPQIATRMPDYGPQVAASLAAWLEIADKRAADPVERTGRNGFGRELVGMKGLGCIGCHNLKGRKSSGIGASDLAEAPKRLRVEWFRDFLIDPGKFHTGTRMPSFWPGGKASNRKVLGGSTARQIDSIWVYLMEIDQSRLPEGMEDKGQFELKPGDRAIVMRTFLDAAGTHGVAVGYPEGVHASFDALEVRWAQTWRGKFLDAENTWDNRFNPPTKPLGDRVADLPLPAAITRENGRIACQFGGYRLGPKGTPTFLYTCDGVEVEDRLEPHNDGRSLRRTVKVRGTKPGLLFLAGRAGSAVKITPQGFAVTERSQGELVAPLADREYVEWIEW